MFWQNLSIELYACKTVCICVEMVNPPWFNTHQNNRSRRRRASGCNVSLILASGGYGVVHANIFTIWFLEGAAGG